MPLHVPCRIFATPNETNILTDIIYFTQPNKPVSVYLTSTMYDKLASMVLDILADEFEQSNKN